MNEKQMAKVHTEINDAIHSIDRDILVSFSSDIDPESGYQSQIITVESSKLSMRQLAEKIPAALSTFSQQFDAVGMSLSYRVKKAA